MKNLFKKIDQVGNRFELYFGESKRLQTLVGAVLTLISLIMITLASIGFISSYYDTSKPEISINQVFDPSYPKINLAEMNMTPMISFFDNSKGVFIHPEEVKKYFTIFAGTVSTHFGSIKEFKVDFVPLTQTEYIPCSKLKKSEKWYKETNSENFIDLAEMYGFCPKIENVSKIHVQGFILSPPEIKYLVEIHPCSLEDKAKCLNPQSITVVFGLPKLSFDKEDFDKPFKIEPSLPFSISIDQSIRKSNKIFLKSTSIFDSRVDFMPETSKGKFAEIDEIKSLTQPRPVENSHCRLEAVLNFACPMYVGLEFLPSGNLKKISRNYKKMLDILGQIGGISKLFLFGGSLIFLILGNFLKKKTKAKILLENELEQVHKFFIGEETQEKEELIKSKKEFWKLVQEFDKKNHDGYRLLKNQNKFEIFEWVFFEDYHRALVPLLQLNSIKEKKEEEYKKLEPKEAFELLVQEESDDPVKIALKAFFIENLPISVACGKKMFEKLKKMKKRKSSRRKMNKKDQVFELNEYDGKEEKVRGLKTKNLDMDSSLGNLIRRNEDGEEEKEIEVFGSENKDKIFWE